MAHAAGIAMNAGRDICIDCGIMTGRCPAARPGGSSPGKEICGMTAMGVCRGLFVPMASQTGGRICTGGNDVGHCLANLIWSWVAGQTLGIVAGAANSAADAIGMDSLNTSPGSHGMAEGTGARITCCRLAKVG